MVLRRFFSYRTGLIGVRRPDFWGLEDLSLNVLSLDIAPPHSFDGVLWWDCQLGGLSSLSGKHLTQAGHTTEETLNTVIASVRPEPRSIRIFSVGGGGVSRLDRGPALLPPVWPEPHHEESEARTWESRERQETVLETPKPQRLVPAAFSAL